MNTPLKRTLIILGCGAVLGLAVIFVFYDAIQPPRPAPRSASDATIGNLSEATTDEILKSIDEDAKALDARYDFNNGPDESEFAAPDFEAELNTSLSE